MKHLLLVATMAFLTLTISAQTDKTAQRKAEFNISKKGLAIEGYDPVAYFTAGKAKEGNAAINLYYQGAVYYFSSAENKELFKANPVKYEPQYGGWCAYAMGSAGAKVEVDPGTFKITNGKLYLFYNKFFNNTLKTWNKEETKLMGNADKNWLKFFKP